MQVTINKTDGTVLCTIEDGALNTSSTNLSLIGRLYRNYGELVNENFVRLLENFANSSSPSTPIVGQLWYNTTNGTLNVYRSSGFISLANLTSSAAQPSSSKAGDLWYDTADSQLKFYTGTVWEIVSPQYSSSQTKTGVFVETRRDQANGNHVCIVHYQQNSVTAIECRDAEWIPQTAISGLSSIQPGYNLADVAGQKFIGTATDADSLGGALAELYLRNDSSGSIDGSLTLTDDGLIVGNASDVTINVNGTAAYIAKADGELHFVNGISTVFKINEDVQTAFAVGSEALPSITFINDEDTGIFSPTEGSVSIVSDGTTVVDISGAGMYVAGLLQADSIEGDISASGIDVGNLTVTGTANINVLNVTGNATLGNAGADKVTINAGTVSVPGNTTFADGWVAFQGQLRVDNVISTTDSSQVNLATGAYIDGQADVTGDLSVNGTIGIGNITLTNSTGALTINTTAGADYSQVGDVNLGRTNGLRSYNTPKAWISFNGTLAGLAVNDSFNIDLVTRTSANNYTFTMENTFTSSAIAVIGTDGVRVVNYPSIGASSFSVTTSSENAKMALAIFYQ